MLGEVAPLNADGDIQVGYRVLNQYGEDITSSILASGIDWNASTVGAAGAVDNDKGVLNIDTPAGTAAFKTGDKVAVTGIDKSSSVVVTGTVTVSNKSMVSDVEFKGFFNAENKELFTDSDFTKFTALFAGKDQYGNSAKAAQLNQDVTIFSSNEAILKVDAVTPFVDGQGANKDQVGVKFVKPESNVSGKVILTAVSKSTGKVAQIEVNVKASASLDTFNISAPNSLVAAKDTVEIPFVAADQYGNALTKYTDIAGKVNLPEGLSLTKSSNGAAVLKYTPATKGVKVLVVTTNTGKVSQLTLDVKEEAKPATIESLKDVSTSVAKDGETTIDFSNLVVKDQYGRSVTAEKFFAAGYTVAGEEVTPADTVVTVSGTIADADDEITISGDTKGSTNLKFTVLDSADAPVATSVLTKEFTVIDKSVYASYELADVGTLYADGAATTHNRAVKVYGVKADGSKVLVPASYYTVLVNDDLLAYSSSTGLNSKVADNAEDTFDTNGNVATKLTVIVDGYETPVTLTKDLTISKAAPKANTVEFVEDTVSNGVTEVSVSALSGADDTAAFTDILEVTDQYGVAIAAPTPRITVTNVVNSDASDTDANVIAVTGSGTTAINVTNAEENDTFNATYVLDGKTVAVKFAVKASE
ncbi:sporulation protein YlmC with PRC-barrel domain [Peribacillus deserti]|uniref:Sporulation protein YlmC with PRC-barrel domain n=1 Tax=Peribacillus deserti TaxID=673318 RepID=A0ABS2QC77_9BACI|nr:hypothetical protein [Peribacillus deserti]MBM7690755.1 sporulation protein YlmC with PRC-barrel domain [Peribacillus deserti]